MQEDVTLIQITEMLRSFAAERDWVQYHTPRNLLLALVGEVGELSEIFQWLGDDGAKPGLAGMSHDKRTHVGEELADVLLYTLRLADICGIDMSSAVLDKMSKNGSKYPAEMVRGSADKYTAYEK